MSFWRIVFGVVVGLAVYELAKLILQVLFILAIKFWSGWSIRETINKLTD